MISLKCETCKMKTECKGSTDWKPFKCEGFVSEINPTKEAIEKAREIIAKANGRPKKTYSK